VSSKNSGSGTTGGEDSKSESRRGGVGKEGKECPLFKKKCSSKSALRNDHLLGVRFVKLPSLVTL
jgi:hypothetical protein